MMEQADRARIGGEVRQLIACALRLSSCGSVPVVGQSEIFFL
jgi:hypothetical protein